MNLGWMLHRSAVRSPAKPAVICGHQVVTYQVYDRSTSALARWFLAEGLEPGDRVAIHWCNSIEVATLYFACFKAGLVAVPVNNRLKAPEIAYILEHSQAKICFSQLGLAPLCRETGFERLHTALPALDASEQGAPLPDVMPDQLAAILYTSGTTARPKGVMHTHVSFRGTTELICELGLGERDILLAMTQMMHVSALSVVLLPGILTGATVVLLPLFDGPAALDLIERWRCSYLISLPAMLRVVVEEQERKPRNVASMRVCLAGGDTVPVTLQESFSRLFGAPVRELFGMTETVPVTCIPADAPRAGSIGIAVEPVETRIADLSGNLLPDGTTGELQVQSPANCVGYWRDPEATRQTFDQGWLRTGDLVRRDSDGYFWFEGRAKQIIVRGGSNISPQEVEEALYHHPAVLEAGVIGMPDARHGEKVIAFVALREGLSAGEEELRDLVRSRIADYKTPERILFLPALPKGLTGKVQRRDLKDIAAASLDSGLSAGA